MGSLLGCFSGGSLGSIHIPWNLIFQANCRSNVLRSSPFPPNMTPAPLIVSFRCAAAPSIATSTRTHSSIYTHAFTHAPTHGSWTAYLHVYEMERETKGFMYPLTNPLTYLPAFVYWSTCCLLYTDPHLSLLQLTYLIVYLYAHLYHLNQTLLAWRETLFCGTEGAHIDPSRTTIANPLFKLNVRPLEYVVSGESL